MGQSVSKPKITTKEERVLREHNKQQIINRKIEKINVAQETLWSNTKANNSIVSYKEFKTLIDIGDTAKAQLSRGGSTLTKSDLIAICIRLEPKYQSKLSELQQYTISDLNTMIRCIIYDVRQDHNQYKLIKY